MLNVTGKYVSVFEVEDKGNYVQANLSTSKKNKDGSYTNNYWKARFVGEAYQPAKELISKDKIHILKGAIENHYDKDWDKLYVTVLVFRFKKSSAIQSPDSHEDSANDKEFEDVPENA